MIDGNLRICPSYPYPCPCECEFSKISPDEISIARLSPRGIYNTVCFIAATYNRRKNLYPNFVEAFPLLVEEWKIIIKCAQNTMARTDIYAVEILRFVIDITSWNATKKNFGNVVALVIHNKLKLIYNDETHETLLTIDSGMNPKALNHLRIDNLPICKLYNTITYDIYKGLCRRFKNKRPCIHEDVASRD